MFAIRWYQVVCINLVVWIAVFLPSARLKSQLSLVSSVMIQFKTHFLHPYSVSDLGYTLLANQVHLISSDTLLNNSVYCLNPSTVTVIVHLSAVVVTLSVAPVGHFRHWNLSYVTYGAWTLLCRNYAIVLIHSMCFVLAHEPRI